MSKGCFCVGKKFGHWAMHSMQSKLLKIRVSNQARPRLPKQTISFRVIPTMTLQSDNFVHVLKHGFGIFWHIL